MCPFCRSDAPVVHRGVLAYCTGCSRLRGPVTARSVTIAGKPSQVGGSVAKIFGYVVLTIGLTLALTLGLLFGWLFPGSLAPWVLSLPVALLSIAVWAMSHFGGKRLTANGKEVERKIREEAIIALAHANRGLLRAETVAGALNLTVRESDALLTEMAKADHDLMAVDVDDNGAIQYRFPRIDLDYRIRVEQHRQAEPQRPAPANESSQEELLTDAVGAFAEFARERASRAAGRR
jgi:hypothetical protein